jgi:phospholipase A1
MKLNLKTLSLFIIQLFFTFSSAAEENKNHTRDAFEQRIIEDRTSDKLKYSFFAHKPFYILPYSYSFNPARKATGTIDEVDRVEVKFQFSFKLNVIESFYQDYLRLSFAYTNLSYWQLYNEKNSAPFRETNHEPDLFLEYKPSGVSSIKGSTYYRLGLVHQSNGQDIELSRSWNRVYFQMVTEIKYSVLSLTFWERLHESPKKSPDDFKGDDNPDISKFMGHFELRSTSKLKNISFSILLRNNLRSDNKGAVEASLSFPLNGKFKGYLQYFNGYGESLIDYDSAIQRVGLGIIMADWL